LLKTRTVKPEKQPLLENGSETTFVSRERLQTNRIPRQESARNSGDTVGNSVFYGSPCRAVIKRTTGARIQTVGRNPPSREDLSVELEKRS
jgi:hypothetical protein